MSIANPEISDADIRAKVVHFMQEFSVETTPRGARKIADFREHLERGTLVYVTSLPGTDFTETADICIRLSREGMRPVPHFTARSITNKKRLKSNLQESPPKQALHRFWLLPVLTKSQWEIFPIPLLCLKPDCLINTK